MAEQSLTEMIVTQVPCPKCGALPGKWCEEADEICFQRFEAATRKMAEERLEQKYFADIAGADEVQCVSCLEAVKGTDAVYRSSEGWTCHKCERKGD